MVNILRNWRQGKAWCRTVAVAAAALLSASAAQAQVDTYTFAPSQGTFTPITGGTVVPDIQDDDEISGAIPLGFNFTYDGTVYTQAQVSSNGWLTFNTAATGSDLTNNLSTGNATSRPLVAPLWDDLDGGGGTASYVVTGTAPNRVFTFEWLNWWWNYTATTAVISFQVKLYEGSNRVEFVYRQDATAIAGTPSASIGLSGSGSGSGSFLSLNNSSNAPTASSATETTSIAAKPATGQIYAFTPAPPAACPAPRNLTATPVTPTGATINWTSLSGGGTYTIEYGLSGFTPGGAGSTSLTSAAGTTSRAITGLTPNTTYQAYVTQNCGGTAGNSTRSGPVSFTTLPVAPTNDNCTTAQALQISNGNFCTTRTAFTLLGATSTTGVPAPTCASYQGGDVWFSVVVPANGALTFETDSISGSPITDSGMEIYSGTCGNLTSIECDDDDSPNGNFSFIDRTGLTPGSTIYIRVWQYGNGSPTGRMAICVRSITPPPPPTNDECATAIAIQSTPVCSSPTSGYVTGATQSLPTTSGCGSVSQANDVWYSFTAVSTGQDILLTPQFSAVLQVYSGTCAALTSVNCVTVASGNSTPRTVTGLTVGQTYYIRVFANVSSVPVSQAIFTLCVKPASGSCTTPTAPAATGITSSGVTLTWAGTLGTGESFSVLYGPRGFTTGTTVNNITATSTTLTGLLPDTDYCFFVSKNCGTLLGVSTPSAETCFRTLITVPLNDDPCGAVNLTASATGLTQTTGTTIGATTTTVGGVASNLPACTPSLAPRDVWYRFTLPAGQTTLNIVMSGNPAGMIRLFTAANCSTAFNMVACRSSTGGNLPVGTQNFTGLTAGTTYYLAVSGYNTNDTQGSFIIGNVLATRNPLVGGELTVFPNPAHGGTLTLRLKGAGAVQAGEAHLINSLGQMVRTQSVVIRNGAAEQQLNIDGLSHGLYTLRVEVGGAAVTRTVVIE